MSENQELFVNAQPSGTRVGPVVLVRPIGQGAWGIVYEGLHDVHGRVAVKEYFPTSYGSRKSEGTVGPNAPQWQDAVRRGLERFAEESRALRTIRHENVVPVLDFIEGDGTALLVMEFVEGRTLAEALQAGDFRDARQIVELGATLVDTLAAIHAKNIIHRDIAPDNIMIRLDGSPVLVDFGGAAAAIATATRSTQNIVKDGYSPPELYDTSSNPTFPVGPWSDIYATAAVLYHVASGRELPVSNARLLAAGAKASSDPLVPLVTIAPPGYSQTWLAAVDGALALVPKNRPQRATAWRQLFEANAIKQSSPTRAIAVAGGGLAAVAALAAIFIAPKLGKPPVAPPSVPVAVSKAATPPQRAPRRHPQLSQTHPRKDGVTPPAPRQPVPVEAGIAVAAVQQAPIYAPAAPVVTRMVERVLPEAPQRAGAGAPVPSASMPRVRPLRMSSQAHVSADLPSRVAPAVVARVPEPEASKSASDKPGTRLLEHLGNALIDRLVAPSNGGSRNNVPAFAPAAAPAPVVNAVAATGQSALAATSVAAAPTPPPVATAAAVTVAAPVVTPTAGAPTSTVRQTHGPLLHAPPVAVTAPAQAVAPKIVAPPTPAPHAADACALGYVWREARPSDHVCVTPADRSTAAMQNSLAASRVVPGVGKYGPNTCKNGYVWREAYAGDVACVTPGERSTAAQQNGLAASHLMP